MIQLADATVAESPLGLRLRALRHAIDNLELEFAQAAVEFQRSDEWDADGYNTAHDWIRLNCHMTSTQVLNCVHVGEQLEQLPDTLETWRDWEIGFSHVAVMARTAHKVGARFDESKLLPLARKHSPGKFFHKVQHYLHAVDAKGYNRDQENLAQQRSLRLSTVEDGCVSVSGILDPIGGAAARAALEPLAQPSGAHDDRTRDQRMADAFVERVTSGQRTELLVTTTLETLRAAAGAAAGDAEFSLPVSSATVQRLACDASVARVLLDQESLVVDVGRSRRVISPTLRKALSVRDGHCQWPGCERPASLCHGHHLHHWAQGGETALGNLILLCPRHHRMVHEGEWQLIRSGEKLIAVAPTINFATRGPD